MLTDKFRDLVVLLLKNDVGVNEEVYDTMKEAFPEFHDIFFQVEATDGMFYLPENWTDPWGFARRV